MPHRRYSALGYPSLPSIARTGALDSIGEPDFADLTKQNSYMPLGRVLAYHARFTSFDLLLALDLLLTTVFCTDYTPSKNQSLSFMGSANTEFTYDDMLDETQYLPEGELSEATVERGIKVPEMDSSPGSLNDDLDSIPAYVSPYQQSQQTVERTTRQPSLTGTTKLPPHCPLTKSSSPEATTTSTAACAKPSRVTKRKSISPSSSDQAEDETSPPRQFYRHPKNRGMHKVPHNIVERRYRDNLNGQLETLRTMLPTLADCGGDVEDVAYRLPPKAKVLSTAATYIKELEAEKAQLAAGNAALKEQVSNLQKLVRCDDCSILQCLAAMQVQQTFPAAA